MKLHELQPAPGSRRDRTRVGRGIAAGKGKTAGRGTKGQKSRSGGSLPPWFEGGQTPLQMRVPKLRGFKNRFKVEYEVVNLGRIAEAVDAGRLAAPEVAEGGTRARRGKPAPLTVNAELLHEAGVIGSLRHPLKVLGGGEIEVPLFVVADACSATARRKIEAAGGTIQLLETAPPATAKRTPGEAAPAAALAEAEPPAAPAEAQAPTPAEATAEPSEAEAEPPAAAAEPVEPAKATAQAEPGEAAAEATAETAAELPAARAPRARKRTAPPAGE
ncbi:MAG TPA: 50S ribosomal protein L15 [Candidatus Dormibacteraeota bacterium]|nr:50S ribosomal protein L15 [Candidatus Dormibacteraeota bacterium]